MCLVGFHVELVIFMVDLVGSALNSTSQSLASVEFKVVVRFSPSFLSCSWMLSASENNHCEI